MFEKRLKAVPPQLLTADGTTDGLVTVASTKYFKVKQQVYLSALALPNLSAEIKAIVSHTQLYVGPINGSIRTRLDVSGYAMIAGATIAANEQMRPSIPFEEFTRAVYEEEPTVALRTFLVDIFGDAYDLANPFPVTVVSTVSADTPTIANVSAAAANTEYSYVIPTSSQRFLVRVRDGLAKMNVCFTAGKTGTEYITVNTGSYYETDGLNTLAGMTVYFRVSKPNQVVEIVSWQ